MRLLSDWLFVTIPTTGVRRLQEDCEPKKVVMSLLKAPGKGGASMMRPCSRELQMRPAAADTGQTVWPKNTEKWFHSLMSRWGCCCATPLRLPPAFSHPSRADVMQDVRAVGHRCPSLLPLVGAAPLCGSNVQVGTWTWRFLEDA